MMTRILPWTLLAGAIFLNIFLLFFGNSSMFPFGVFDFSFFAILIFLFALYRPGWAFLLFLSLLPFERINMAPEAIPLSIRPYQLFGAAIACALFFRFLFHRLPFLFTKFRFFDAFPIVFALGGFWALFFAPEAAIAAKQAGVVLSFVVFYFLSRQFLGDTRDVKRVLLFLVASATLTTLFALWQSFRFTLGLPSFEAMPGRPNAFFSEPDWLGMYLIFSTSLALSVLFFLREKIFSKKLDHEKETLLREKGSEEENTKRSLGMSRDTIWLMLCFGFLTLSFLGLLLTVARSAWIGALLSTILFLKLLLFGNHFSWNPGEWRWKSLLSGSMLVASAFSLALFAIWAFQLTTFDLGNRAGSTASGLQEITLSCNAPTSLPEKIENVSELSPYNCRHIRLEEIETEKNSGKFITTTLRPDPSIEARRDIQKKTISTLKDHWIAGIGWGNIGSILGTDDRGTSLNASNAFLETWLGGGFASFVALLLLWIFIPLFAFRKFFAKRGEDTLPEDRALAVFFLISWAGFTLFNFFNSGILLGFIWVWLGGIGLIATKKPKKESQS